MTTLGSKQQRLTHDTVIQAEKEMNENRLCAVLYPLRARAQGNQHSKDVAVSTPM